MDKKKRIAILSKLAMYDKLYGKIDSKIDNYFLHDYISKQNIITRIYVGFGGMLLLCFYWFHQYAINEVNLLLVDWTVELPKMGIFILSLLIGYSILGLFIWGQEYKASKTRRKLYYNYSEQLRNLDENSKSKKPKEANRRHYGADTIN